jgi:glycerophosphoryl diester phosphodiesterase
MTLPAHIRFRGREVLLKYHRLLSGTGAWAPNSMEALGEVLEGGAAVIEIDVRLAADGRFVLLHDSTLERETSGVGPVDRIGSEDFRALRLRGSDSRGITFDDAVERLLRVERPLKLQIDLKEARPLSDAAIDTLLQGIGRLEANPGLRVVVGCLADWNLRALRRVQPDLAVGLDFAFHLDAVVDELPRLPTRVGAYGYLDDHPLAYERVWDVARYLEDRFAAMIAQVPGAAEYYLRKELLARALADGFDPIAYLHRHRPGCLVDVWTIDPDTPEREAALFQALAAGCDQITTNLAVRAAALVEGASPGERS